MPKAAKRRTDHSVTMTSRQSPPNGSATLTDTDIARRAFELYCARGGQHGHDVEDWLRAETELRAAVQRGSA